MPLPFCHILPHYCLTHSAHGFPHLSSGALEPGPVFMGVGGRQRQGQTESERQRETEPTPIPLPSTSLLQPLRFFSVYIHTGSLWLYGPVSLPLLPHRTHWQGLAHAAFSPLLHDFSFPAQSLFAALTAPPPQDDMSLTARCFLSF